MVRRASVLTHRRTAETTPAVAELVEAARRIHATLFFTEAEAAKHGLELGPGVEGYEHNEIARIMDCSIGNSKSQLHKARTRLREILKDFERDRARQQRLEASEKTGSRE